MHGIKAQKFNVTKVLQGNMLGTDWITSEHQGGYIIKILRTIREEMCSQRYIWHCRGVL